MSSFQEQGDSSSDGQHKGLSKFIRRASRALRPKSIAGPPSGAEDVQTAAARPRPPPNTPAPATSPRAGPAHEEAMPAITPIAATAVVAEPSHVGTLNVHRSGVPSAVTIPRPEIRDHRSLGKNQQEKAQLLFAKYGLTLDSSDWTSPTRSGSSEVQWVEKKIRMRVHRQCHECSTIFGAKKACVNCSHVRCKKCPRFPPKAGVATAPPPTEGLAVIEKQLHEAVPVGSEGDVSMAAPPSEPADQPASGDKENIAPLVAPPVYLQIDSSDQTDKLVQKVIGTVHQRRGVDVVYRPPVHRVRRFCHKCEGLFKGRSTVCEACGHQRCPNCPREPAKPMKFASGYPGDVPEPEPTYPALERVWRKPRTRVRYTCEQCHTVFNNSGEKHCRSCKHVRCTNCIRDPTRKTARDHPEELLKSLEGKFTGLQLLSTAPGRIPELQQPDTTA